MAFTLDTEARGLLPFYAILVQLHTFTVLRQNALTFTLPPPYARFMSVALMRASVQCHVLVRAQWVGTTSRAPTNWRRREGAFRKG